MMSPVIVREATGGDVFTAENLSKEVFAELRKVYRPSAAAIAAKQSVAESLSRLVAVCDRQIVGTLQYRFIDHEVRVLDLAVHSDARRLGVARQLFSALELIGGDQGANRIALYTVEQTGNVPIFEKLGFQVVHTEAAGLFESDIHETITEAYMVRQIESVQP